VLSERYSVGELWDIGTGLVVAAGLVGVGVGVAAGIVAVAGLALEFEFAPAVATVAVETVVAYVFVVEFAAGQQTGAEKFAARYSGGVDKRNIADTGTGL